MGIIREDWLEEFRESAKYSDQQDPLKDDGSPLYFDELMGGFVYDSTRKRKVVESK